MTKKRFALIIASCQYEDEGLRQLIAPPQDAKSLAKVLSDPDIGDFEVQTILNEPSHKVNQAVETFFADRKRDDLLLLYFSGHGIKDKDGRLYFATSNTSRKRLRSTAIPATFVNEVMRCSHSRQQVLILDCCYSGAFAKGMVAKADRVIDTKEHFRGKGRVVLTASDALQYAFEGDKITEEDVVRSVFTHTLVHGLKTGEADLDRDGHISPDELYDYVLDRVTEKTPQQRPEKWAFGMQGEIIIAHNPAPPKVSLPMWVTQLLANPNSSARFHAVTELSNMLHNPVLGNLAHAELERISREDQNPIVRGAAAGAIEVSPAAMPAKTPMLNLVAEKMLKVAELPKEGIKRERASKEQKDVPLEDQVPYFSSGHLEDVIRDLDMNDQIRQILELVDGKRRIRDIVRESSFDREQVVETLHNYRRTGVLRGFEKAFNKTLLCRKLAPKKKPDELNGLKYRLATGEITVEDYEKLKSALENEKHDSE